MAAQRSLVKIPYRTFRGREVIVRGFRNRGICRVKILERIRVKGETETPLRHMKCEVVEVYRDNSNISSGQVAMIPILHSVKEIVKTIVPLP